MSSQKSYKGKKQYPAYKANNSFAVNLLKKLERHVKSHPDDKLAEKAHEAASKGVSYRRKVPNLRPWKSRGDREYAQMNAIVKRAMNADKFNKAKIEPQKKVKTTTKIEI